jgi:hypothetical protein
MNRHQFETHQPTYTVHGDQSREIGLRAVAAAILYQGDASNVERALSREPAAATDPATQPGDHKP